MNQETIKPINVKQGIDALAGIDHHIAAVRDAYGYPEDEIWPMGFETFLSTIVSQQISSQAAATIMSRVRSLFKGRPNAEDLLSLPKGALRAAGLSGRKVEYVTSLARAVVDERFIPENLNTMDNQPAIDYIVALRGLGRWSAEIYLLFSLQRPDVFPADDLAIRLALQKVKGLEDCPTARQARDAVEHWAPWRSAGSLLLWHFYEAGERAKQANNK